MPFIDRVEAGRRLAPALTHLRGDDVVVLGLPRGGVPVAFEVARALDAPLDVIVVRKIGVPWQPELAMGAVGEDGATIVNIAVVEMAQVDRAELTAAADTARGELDRRVERLRGDRPRIDLSGKTAVVVDDGIATGATARVACRVAKAQGADRVVLAVPVGSPHAVTSMADAADEVVCVEQPAGFQAVGQYYDDFSATTDADVTELLDQAIAARGS
ncbi:MAG TPA: phosphoribosyltransferase [Planosporangium sp.]|nr:phosphoribosyltransferase [Planosporangium sp.]